MKLEIISEEISAFSRSKSPPLSSVSLASPATTFATDILRLKKVTCPIGLPPLSLRMLRLRLTEMEKNKFDGNSFNARGQRLLFQRITRFLCQSCSMSLWQLSVQVLCHASI